MLGMESTSGRHPRAEEVSSKEAFVYYLQGVVLSAIHAETKSQRVTAKHCQISPDTKGGDLGEHERGVVIAAPGPTASEQAEWDDLKDALFANLRAQVPQRLRTTLDAWEQVFPERIPNVRFPKYVVELREYAQRVLTQIGLERPVATPTIPAASRVASNTTAPSDVASVVATSWDKCSG